MPVKSRAETTTHKNEWFEKGSLLAQLYAFRKSHKVDHDYLQNRRLLLKNNFLAALKTRHSNLTFKNKSQELSKENNKYLSKSKVTKKLSEKDFFPNSLSILVRNYFVIMDSVANKKVRRVACFLKTTLVFYIFWT